VRPPLTSTTTPHSELTLQVDRSCGGNQEEKRGTGNKKVVVEGEENQEEYNAGTEMKIQASNCHTLYCVIMDWVTCIT
jgi:hypothetical protein